MNDVVVRTNVISGALIQQVKTDLYGCGFGFYRAKHGYIIYGEEDHISLYDFNDHYYEIDYNGILIKEQIP